MRIIFKGCGFFIPMSLVLCVMCIDRWGLRREDQSVLTMNLSSAARLPDALSSVTVWLWAVPSHWASVLSSEVQWFPLCTITQLL